MRKTTIWEYAESIQRQYAGELKQLGQMQKMWALGKPILDARIFALQGKIQRLEQKIDEIVMERIAKKNEYEVCY